MNKKLKYGAYHDRVERRDGKIWFQNHFCKDEEGHINQEHLVAVGLDDEDLTPVLFNYRSEYRESETVIDGTIRDGSFLKVNATVGGVAKPEYSRSTPKRAFLSTLFPYWMARRLPKTAVGNTQSFLSLVEDGSDPGFNSVGGKFTPAPPDELAKSRRLALVDVVFRDQPSRWYLAADGAAQRIEMSKGQTVIERASESVAKAFNAKCRW